MAYYRVITPAGHLAPGTVVCDEHSAPAGSGALFNLREQTARKMVQSGVLEPIPDPDALPPVPPEPGWRADEEEAEQRPGRRRKE